MSHIKETRRALGAATKKVQDDYKQGVANATEAINRTSSSLEGIASQVSEIDTYEDVRRPLSDAINEVIAYEREML